MQFINLNHKRFNFGILSTELKHFFVGQCFSGENNIRAPLEKLRNNFIYMYLNYNYVYKVFHRTLIPLFEGYWFMISQSVFHYFLKKAILTIYIKQMPLLLLFSTVTFKHTNNKL